MKRQMAALAVALCITSAMACHGPLARRRPQPEPPTETMAVIAPPEISDGAWIDSVTKSWSTGAARDSPDSALARARAPQSRESSSVAHSTGPTAITGTAYAEAAPMSAAISGAADDHGPLLLLIAIGAVALLIAIEAGRVALRP